MASLPQGFESCRWCGVILVLLTFIGYGLGRGENNGCSSVKLAYGLRGLATSDVPNKMISGENLRVCIQGATCCTPQMEAKLETKTREENARIMADKLELLRQTFISRTQKFETFFQALIENAERDLHDMFVRTYGLLYQQNAQVFTDLFRKLKAYYKGEDLNLMDVLDEFFSNLMEKMFQLLNASYTFDDSYLQCVTEHMDELQPFGDVPQKLSVQVKRAFVAARTFVQGLRIGRDVVLEMSKVQSSQSCERAMMRLLHCPYCRGMPNVRPCNNYCMNVMKGCLAHHADLDAAWNSYIVELMKVADRLEGPFNIESVVDPIDVKISDGIMNFQENAEKVSEKVFQGCGRPQLGQRAKRNVESDDGIYTEEEQSFSWQTDRRGQYVRPTTAVGTSLDRLVRGIREQVQVTRGFWAGLPHAVCNDIAAPVNELHHCWNGQGSNPYLPPVVGDGVVNQLNNPEVEVDISRQHVIVSNQLLQLNIITNKLRSAYNGLDVDWIDEHDMDFSGSGSGSGSGDDGPPFVDPNVIRYVTTKGPLILTRPHVVYTPPPPDPPFGTASPPSRSSLCLVITALVLCWVLHWRQH